MSQIRSDFCVVGGGPAGLTLALSLLRSGARVTLVERHRSLERAYRGEILQPGGARVLEQLGVLTGARDRGAHELTHFRLTDGSRTLMNVDYGVFPPPHDHLLALPQAHLLAELHERCALHQGFTPLLGNRITGLVRDGERVVGVRSAGAKGEYEVLAHCTVAADGRYSKTRALAGIGNDRAEVFETDVLWFRLPAEGRAEPSVTVHRGDGGPVIVHPSPPNRLQLGWTLPHGDFARIREQGLEWMKEQVAATIPGYADLIHEHVHDFSDLVLLDVFSSVADRWSGDGLLLIGDSAHTHGPLGAQGINLAIQDAAIAHPLLIGALGAGDFGAHVLSRFERQRRPDIERTMRFQVMQSKGLLSRNRLASAARRVVLPLFRRSPAYPAVTRRIAFGAPVRVSTELFTATERV